MSFALFIAIGLLYFFFVGSLNPCLEPVKVSMRPQLHESLIESTCKRVGNPNAPELERWPQLLYANMRPCVIDSGVMISILFSKAIERILSPDESVNASDF
jgi:hypothetical protein